MTSDPGLLANLVVAILAALIGAFLAVRLRQSVILGYLLAGVAIGPFTPGFVGDAPIVQQLADIGIILLMFGVGLQVSFQDLLRSGRVALVGGNIQVALLLGIGYLAGLALGWQPLEALFLGAVVSNSSSTVLTKTLSEKGDLDSEHGHVGLAWSSVQDLGTVVLVVVLSALAAPGDNLLVDSLWSFARAGLFLVIVGPLGSVLLPRLFERVADMQNRELFVLTVAAVALGAAYGSTFFGLSLALGAFVAGVVVGESDLSHQILGEVTPIRDIFTGLFFVSVGMLINPMIVLENPVVVLLTVGLIVLVKGLISTLLTLFFGYSRRTALLTGVILAQSAEFSFLLARVGTDLGVVSPDAFSLMLAGVAVSMALSPILYSVASSATERLGVYFPTLSSAETSAGPSADNLKEHAVICGYGRVGRIIAGALSQRGLPFIVIGEDPRLVRELSARGIMALLGNPANPVLLERSGVAQARVLVVATPDPLTSRLIVDHSRRFNPNLDIVVRTHSWSERDFMLGRGVGEVVMGELELALEMTRHTLHRFGVSTLDGLDFIRGLRQRVEREPYSDILDEGD